MGEETQWSNGTVRLWLVPLIVCRWQHVQGKQIKFSDASKSKQNQNEIVIFSQNCKLRGIEW
jgi:hypothetical protein